VDFEATIRSLSALADASMRRQRLDALARALGADAMRVAIADPAQPARFTVPPSSPGWPDTSCWSTMLERCKVPGIHESTLTSPTVHAAVPAVGYAFPRLAIVLVGHTRGSRQLVDAFGAVAPLLASLFAAEHDVQTTRKLTLARAGQELRTPLAPIANAVQLLRLDGSRARVHDILDRQVSRVLELVDGMIALGSDRATGSQRPLDPDELSPLRSVARGTGTHGAAVTTGPAVLVVDDNRDAADLLGTLLASLGYAVQVAHTGPDGLALLDAFTPDIALLDIGLPGMDGYELARELHARLPALPLVAITGYGQDKDRARAFAAGFAAHLVKPVSMTSLSDVLAELLPAAR